MIETTISGPAASERPLGSGLSVAHLGSGLYPMLRGVGDPRRDALAREVARLREATSSFLVYLVFGFSAYALVIKHVADAQWKLANATVLSGPLILAMAAAATVWIRRSGFSRQVFGLTWERAGRHALEATVWTAPVLVALACLKWSALTVLEVPGARVFPFLHGGRAAGPWIAALVYALLVPVQEFLARGVLQGALYKLLVGSRVRRHCTAILVSNALFAVTHLHLSIRYGFAAFLGGLLWGVLYARQGSLVGPVVSHVLIGVFTLTALDMAGFLKGFTG